MNSTLLSFFYHHFTFRPQPLPKDVRLEGQTAIVTGSNTGLGFEAARQLAEHGVSRLILGVRNVAKGEDAKARILKQLSLSSEGGDGTGQQCECKCDIRVWPLDQESFASVVRFAARANDSRELDRVDMVCLNAGLKRLVHTYSDPPSLPFSTSSSSSSSSESGRQQKQHEAHIQTNHLGTALLSLLLLPVMRRTSREFRNGQPARMTLTASSVAFFPGAEDALVSAPPPLPPLLQRRGKKGTRDGDGEEDEVEEEGEEDTTPLITWLDSPASFDGGLRKKGSGTSGKNAVTPRESEQRYCLSKLLNVFWTRELASRINGSGSPSSPSSGSGSVSVSGTGAVLVNCVNPGFCMSEFHRSDPGSARFGNWIAWSSQQGAYHIVDAVVGCCSTSTTGTGTAGDAAGGRSSITAGGRGRHVSSHGGYLSEMRVDKPGPYVLSQEGQQMQKRIWDETLAVFRRECPDAVPLLEEFM